MNDTGIATNPFEWCISAARGAFLESAYLQDVGEIGWQATREAFLRFGSMPAHGNNCRCGQCLRKWLKRYRFRSPLDVVFENAIRSTD